MFSLLLIMIPNLSRSIDNIVTSVIVLPDVQCDARSKFLIQNAVNVRFFMLLIS